MKKEDKKVETTNLAKALNNQYQLGIKTGELNARIKIRHWMTEQLSKRKTPEALEVYNKLDKII